MSLPGNCLFFACLLKTTLKECIEPACIHKLHHHARKKTWPFLMRFPWKSTAFKCDQDFKTWQKTDRSREKSSWKKHLAFLQKPGRFFSEKTHLGYLFFRISAVDTPAPNALTTTTAANPFPLIASNHDPFCPLCVRQWRASVPPSKTNLHSYPGIIGTAGLLLHPQAAERGWWQLAESSLKLSWGWSKLPLSCQSPT